MSASTVAGKFCVALLALCCLGTLAWAGPPGVGPTVVQYQTYQTAGTNGETNSVVQFNTPTTAGNTIWVAVTMSDYAVIHTLVVTDTQGNTYTLLNQENDGSPGYQTVAHFYAANIAGDTTVPNTVTLSSTWENYRGMVVVEIAGTATPPLLASAANIQDGLPAGTNNVTSTPISVAAGQTPALLVALTMNTSGGSSDLGGSGFGAPAAGSGFTQVAQMWNWGLNLATLETEAIPTFVIADGGVAAPPNESFAALFSAPDTDSYVTVAAMFLSSSATSTAPTVNLAATPKAIVTGATTTIKWSTSNASTCVASGGWSGSQPTSGATVIAPTATNTYVLTCANNSASTASSVTVNVGAATGPTLVQYNTHQTLGAAGEGNSSLSFQTLTTAGHAIWVGATVSDYASAHKISVTDSQGNHYTLLDQRNDEAPGYQSVAHFYAANIAGDTHTPDTIHVSWPWDSYKGVVIAEVAGTSGAPEAHSANLQDGLAAGINNVTSGSLPLSTSAPALVLALSMNTSGGSSDLGGSGFGAPGAGAGFVQRGQLWNWGVNLATLETESIASATSTAAVFDAPDTDSYVTVAAVFH